MPSSAISGRTRPRSNFTEISTARLLIGAGATCAAVDDHRDHCHRLTGRSIVMVLSAHKLTLGYRGHAVVSNVSFEVSAGDVLAVVGHNGSGKSTLVKTILGTLPMIGGEIAWHGEKPSQIAFLGQRSEFDTRVPVRLRDIVEMGAWSRLGFGGRIDREGRAAIDAAMTRTGTASLADMPLHTLSAGQLRARCSPVPLSRTRRWSCLMSPSPPSTSRPKRTCCH